MEKIRIEERPESISLELIQSLLSRAHQSNIAKNLRYATAHQSVETLEKKMQNGVCYVALAEGDQLVGTVTMTRIQQRYWYNHGPAMLIKLLGVDPAYRGRNISGSLIAKCLEYAREAGAQVIVSDSAEHNEAVKGLLHKYGFETVDYCVYAANNFYTNVYARWEKGCPFPAAYRMLRYHMKRCWIRFKYKPGKKARFQWKRGEKA